ncbi:uncharacterized protein LOC100827076 [Brachypodium distachyon]|uniref:Methyltransferase type 11 domain-containing protein n=1 Tax=Brachypodium distachyon TaxID=15368 RepID=I1I0K2_BRADI|nr:uncharacterized protein LOC100827076 [Brachypodium distachyon]KQJ94902.1 hypothetical protein BRADI_3g13950v3 [Brachypodium distachyon]|eukprot:XP_003571335.1 uncharacterized protein LOC100827076 [Brachypodium distachyon]
MRADAKPRRAFLLLLLILPFFLFLLYSYSSSPTPSAAAALLLPTVPLSPYIRMRRGASAYRTYDDYLKHQLAKTLSPRLRRIWSTRDWHRKVAAFAAVFSRLQSANLLSNTSRALCVGARLGQEVAALRLVGVADSVGIDLAPAPPLVLQGDFHRQPFPDARFDFEFSNVFDHALYPARFAAEIERTLRPGGVAVLHVAVHRRGDRYSANDLMDVKGLIGLFGGCEVVEVSKVDAFGLDTEVILRKKMKMTMENKISSPALP